MDLAYRALNVILSPFDRLSERQEERDRQWLEANPGILEKARADHAAFRAETNRKLAQLEAWQAANPGPIRRLRIAWRSLLSRLTWKNLHALDRDHAREAELGGETARLSRARIETFKTQREQMADDIKTAEMRQGLR